MYIPIGERKANIHVTLVPDKSNWLTNGLTPVRTEFSAATVMFSRGMRNITANLFFILSAISSFHIPKASFIPEPISA